MKTKIIKSTTTFILVTAVMAATTFNFANEKNDNILSKTNYYNNFNTNEKYFGSYSISPNSINNFAKHYLKNNLSISLSSKDYSNELNLIINALNKSEILREDLLGELKYTINANKLIIEDIAGGESFVLDYKIKDNVLYAKVYDFSQELAIGKFVDNGKYLIVNSPSSNTIFLEHDNA